MAPTEEQSFQKQVKVALLVGVSHYPDGSGFAALHYAASDAEELGAVLKQQGYLVSVLTDNSATRGVILRTLQQLSGAVDPNQGTFLFYFSGHGFSIAGENYLAPISASESDLAREGLPVEEVEQVLNQSKAKRQLMLLDACRNDVAAGSKGAGGRSFSALAAAEGLRILNSTRLGQVSYESAELKHGVFTAFLLDALKGQAAGSDGLVTFHDVSDYVTDSVRRWGVEHGRVQVPFEAVGKIKEASGDFLVARVTSRDSNQLPVQTPLAPKRDDATLARDAINSHDPAQMQAAASKISDPQIANGLNLRAQAALAFAANDHAKVFQLYKQLADSGDVQAMSGVAMEYYYGRGTAVDYAAAERYFQKAADKNDLEACRMLSTFYSTGTGLPLNYELAVKYAQRGIDLGDANSMFQMGFFYQMGRGVHKDKKQAIEWYRKAAALKLPAAVNMLKSMGVTE